MKSVGLTLLILAGVLIAPHLEWTDARLWALVCIVAAIPFLYGGV